MRCTPRASTKAEPGPIAPARELPTRPLLASAVTSTPHFEVEFRRRIFRRKSGSSCKNRRRSHLQHLLELPTSPLLLPPPALVLSLRPSIRVHVVINHDGDVKLSGPCALALSGIKDLPSRPSSPAPFSLSLQPADLRLHLPPCLHLPPRLHLPPCHPSSR